MISEGDIRLQHSVGKRLYCKHFLSRNAGIEEDEDKRELSVTKSKKGAIATINPKFEEPETLWEVVDGVKNYLAATYMIRPYSYEALALDRVLHQVRYFARPVENCADQGNAAKLQMSLAKKLFDDVLLHNSNCGRVGKPPATYEVAMRLARNVLTAKQLSEVQISQGEIYSVAEKRKTPITQRIPKLQDTTPKQKGGGGGGGARGGRGGARGGGRGRGGRGGGGHRGGHGGYGSYGQEINPAKGCFVFNNGGKLSQHHNQIKLLL